jgi:transcriptional regulator with PAS, ATPase and Fis domain
MFIAVIKRATGTTVREFEGNKQAVLAEIKAFYVPKKVEELENVIQEIKLYESAGAELLPTDVWLAEVQNKEVAETAKKKEVRERALLAELKEKYESKKVR